MYGLADPGRGLLTATGTAEFARSLGVTICGLDDCARVRMAARRPGVTARGHTGPATCHVTVAGLVTALPSLLTVCSRGREVSGMDRVARIARRLLLLPGITATLGRRWSPPLHCVWFHPSSHVLFPGAHQAVPQFVGARGPVGMRLLGLC